ncbi:hypothetical protein PIB30_010659 [Stylosanthes scabra]|uniref:Uncharacterized protein n=1 Tax=Stylosanthes scabra TaxID=79078 RepID=A0ABU6V5X0_9FABA|nr:hypothetical protein [Stylosanthes scabra]
MATSKLEMQKHQWCSHCVRFCQVFHEVHDKYWSNSCDQCGKILSDSSVIDNHDARIEEEIGRMLHSRGGFGRRKKKIVVDKQNHDDTDTEQEEKKQETKIKSNDDDNDDGIEKFL